MFELLIFLLYLTWSPIYAYPSIVGIGVSVTWTRGDPRTRRLVIDFRI